MAMVGPGVGATSAAQVWAQGPAPPQAQLSSGSPAPGGGRALAPRLQGQPGFCPAPSLWQAPPARPLLPLAGHIARVLAARVCPHPPAPERAPVTPSQLGL